MSKISVIIPTYNRAELLAETLLSALEQTLADREIIVVDDGSTDRTSEVAKTFQDRIIYLRQPNSGPAKARNAGIRLAKGKYIAFLDSDDLWLPEKLELQYRFLEQTASIGLVFTDVMWFSNGQVLLPSLRERYQLYSGQVFEKLLFDNWIATSSVLVRRECLEEVGGFDEDPQIMYVEDWNLWIRLARQYQFALVDKVLVKRRYHPHRLGLTNPEKQFKAILYNLEKLRRLYPELEEKSELFDQKYYQIGFQRGYEDLNVIQPKRARPKLALALKHKKNLKTIFYYLLTFMPAPLLKAGKSLVRIWKRK
jgi:glycosyltransferase involved in cell wall biosynthesis